MPIQYLKADRDVRGLVQTVMQRYHPALVFAEVRVDVLMARHVGDGDAPAVLLHGYPCAAIIGAQNAKARALGMGDVLITVDLVSWDSLDDRGRMALIDHELMHIEVLADGGGTLQVAKNEDNPDGPPDVFGRPSLDLNDRPRLKMRLHDWQIGGFNAIAHRWGDEALEVRNVHSFRDRRTGQYCWDFAVSEAEAREDQSDAA